MKIMVALTLFACLGLCFAGCLESNPQPAPGSGNETEDPQGPDDKRADVLEPPGAEDTANEPIDGTHDAGAPDLPMIDLTEDEVATPVDVVEDEVEPPVDMIEEDVAPQPEYHPLYDFVGAIKILERTEPDGKVGQTSLEALLYDGPSMPFWGSHLESSGDCAYYQNLIQPKCDPECEPWVEFCGLDKQCYPSPQRASAGTITFDGLAVPATLTPDNTAWYHIEWEQPEDLFTPDSEILVSADGAEVPAFEVELSGVGDMAAAWGGMYTLEDGKDNEFAWTPQGDGSIMELAIVTGWHGAPPPAMIWCSAPDEAGKIVVPQKFVEAFPPAGGVGLFQHISWANRVKRKVVEGPFGLIQVAVMSELMFSISH